MLEKNFQSHLIKQIKSQFEGSMVLKTDPGHIQGIPDLIILYGDRWAALECKKSRTSSIRPNQQYYIDKMNAMSFARFIFPENKKEVLHALSKALRLKR